MATQSRRGRTAARRKTNNLLPLYGLLALAVVGGLVLLGLSLGRPQATAPVATGTSNIDVSTLGSFPSKGSADAPVTVVEFADYQCPSCAAFANNQAAQIDKDFVDTGKVRFIYHELPIPSHANAVVAAEAARAAGDQDKYWDMNKLLFARQNDWARLTNEQAIATFGGYAQELGLNVETFNQALQSGKHRPAIQQALQQSNQARIQFTPSFVINGKIYEAKNLRAAIEAALATQS